MTNIGEKIRGIRTLKGYSQENMAAMLDLSLPTYADIERGKKEVTIKRLEQIAEKLGCTLNDILSYHDKVNIFFEQCNQPNVNAGKNGSQNNFNDDREQQHEIEKLKLQLKLSEAEKEKAQLEAKYWRETGGKS
jgi:XRE family transcriptional regulator, regulator of sulfur utilization